MTTTEAVREQRERDGRDDPERGAGHDGDDGDDERGPDPSKPVRRAFGVVSRRPVLLFAFALAAVVVAAADVARILDPVGNALPNTLGGGVSFAVLTHPSGTRVSTLTLGAVVGLRPNWFVVAFALAVVAPVASGTATAWTVARATNRRFTWERARATTTYAVAVVVVWQAANAVVELVEPLLVPVLLVGIWLSARLFPAPALAALGQSPLDAASEAYALTRGRAFGCFLSVLGVGTLSAFLANAGSVAGASPSDPAFALGTALSYTFAGAIGAVAATIYAVEAREEREAARKRRERATGSDTAGGDATDRDTTGSDTAGGDATDRDTTGTDTTTGSGADSGRNGN
jgi:uncharacterized membrane protein (DUF441 family)